MKKIKGLIALLIISLMLSGCMKVEYNLVVTEEDVSVNGSSLFSKAALAELQQMFAEMGEEGQGEQEGEDEFDLDESMDSYNDEYEENGFTTEEYEDDEYQGIKFQKSFGSLASLSTTDNIEYSSIDDKNLTKLFVMDDSDPTKTKYTAKIKIKDLQSESEGEEGALALDENDEDLQELLSSMDYKFKVSLPVAPLTNNATTVSGTNLTWDLTTFEGEYVEFSFELPKNAEQNNELKITEGANQTYTKGSNKDIVIKTNGEMNAVTAVEIDNGNVIDPKNYTLASGSTILTLKAAFLESSSIGEHTITIKYEGDKEVETKLTIAAVQEASDSTEGSSNNETNSGSTNTDKTNNPKTGDNIMINVMAAFFSTQLLIGSIICLRKNNI